MLKLLHLTAKVGVRDTERLTNIRTLTAVTCAAISYYLPVIIALAEHIYYLKTPITYCAHLGFTFLKLTRLKL